MLQNKIITAPCENVSSLYRLGNKPFSIGAFKFYAMEEIWMPIKNYEGLYEVSNLGNVKSLNRLVENSGNAGSLNRLVKYYQPIRERILKPIMNTGGYYGIILHKNGKPEMFRVGGLVLAAFIKPKNKNLQVNHINGIKSDNRLVNLEWCTPSENMIHAYKNKLMISPCGSKHYNSKINENDVLDIIKLHNSGLLKNTEIAKMYNMSKSNIGSIIKRKFWKHVIETL